MYVIHVIRNPFGRGPWGALTRRLISSFTALQDTTTQHGPTDVFFHRGVVDKHGGAVHVECSS
jgi:hypothetical protein